MTNWLGRLLGETHLRLLSLLRRSRQTITPLAEAVGAQAAAEAVAGKAATKKQRLEVAAGVFRDLGADVDVQQTPAGWRLQGYGCPLSAVTSGHAEMCELGRALVEDVVGAPVRECCQRGDHPRCAFEVVDSAA